MAEGGIPVSNKFDILQNAMYESDIGNEYQLAYQYPEQEHSKPNSTGHSPSTHQMSQPATTTTTNATCTTSSSTINSNPMFSKSSNPMLSNQSFMSTIMNSMQQLTPSEQLMFMNNNQWMMIPNRQVGYLRNQDQTPFPMDFTGRGMYHSNDQRSSSLNNDFQLKTPPNVNRTQDSSMSYSDITRMPGSGGRASVRRRRESDEENTSPTNIKKVKLSTTLGEVAPLLIVGNLTGYDNYELVNAEFTRFMDKTKIKRIKIIRGGRILVVAHNKDDRAYLLSHYPSNDIFKGLTQLTEAKEPVNFDFSIVMMDIPLGSSNEEIERLLNNSNVSYAGIQRLRNRSNQETTSIRIDLPTKEVKDAVLKDGIRFDLVSLRLKDFEKPKPRLKQCYRCQGYGHTQRECPDSLKCLRCSKSHRSSECEITNPTHYCCPNCGGQHVSVDRNCPARIKEMKMQEQNANRPRDQRMIRTESAMPTIKRLAPNSNRDSPRYRNNYLSPRRQTRGYPLPSTERLGIKQPTLKELIEKEQETFIGLILATIECTSRYILSKNVAELADNMANAGKMFNINFNTEMLNTIINRISGKYSPTTTSNNGSS